uniref:Uncharacterized protein n=1 Tax=Aquisalinus luteolus TaxID=1566827 RepID=A0A8J3EQ23_9PROT|nr:hypothetical protein GCM10011355_04420 [Aquisalinus luteolus]
MRRIFQMHQNVAAFVFDSALRVRAAQRHDGGKKSGDKMFHVLPQADVNFKRHLEFE